MFSSLFRDFTIWGTKQQNLHDFQERTTMEKTKQNEVDDAVLSIIENDTVEMLLFYKVYIFIIWWPNDYYSLSLQYGYFYYMVAK